MKGREPSFRDRDDMGQYLDSLRDVPFLDFYRSVMDKSGLVLHSAQRPEFTNEILDCRESDPARWVRACRKAGIECSTSESGAAGRPFSELTQRQRELLINIIAELSTGEFEDEFFYVATSSGRRLQLQGKKGKPNKEILGVVRNDLDVLADERYVTLRQSGATPFLSLREKALREYREYTHRRETITASAPQGAHLDVEKTRNVFVVHGRNEAARRATFEFLRALGLNPLEWTQLVRETGKGSPYIGQVLDTAFDKAQAIVALFTPDDLACLRKELQREDDDQYEKQPTAQARPNVLFEAGMAFGKCADRTILVQLGKIRPFSDVAGRHMVRLSNSPETRNDLAGRLQKAGCPVNTAGNNWLSAGDFSAIAGHEFVETEVAAAFTPPQSQDLDLTEDEIDYLLKIAEPANDGRILRAFFEHQSGREVQRHRAMLEKFVDLEIMRDDIESWTLTAHGYEVIDSLKK